MNIELTQNEIINLKKLSENLGNIEKLIEDAKVAIEIAKDELVRVIIEKNLLRKYTNTSVSFVKGQILDAKFYNSKAIERKMRYAHVIGFQFPYTIHQLQKLASGDDSDITLWDVIKEVEKTKDPNPDPMHQYDPTAEGWNKENIK